MIVAVISTHTVDEDPMPTNIAVPLTTGPYLALLTALGLEDGERLAKQYAMQDSDQHVCSGNDTPEPEFHLHDIAGITDPLYLFASKRLAMDEYVTRKCKNAPDVLILCGKFVDEVEDWDTEAFCPSRKSGEPLRLIDVAARAVYAACNAQYSITRSPATDVSDPMVIVRTYANNPWFRRLYVGREVYL